MKMAENWFYANDQERLGPFTDPVIRKMAASGIIGASTYVWHEGLPGWVRAGESELAGDLIPSCYQKDMFLIH